eukprot:scaffold78_cov96-Cylindrotheca_fusiformis.AAC.5
MVRWQTSLFVEENQHLYQRIATTSSAPAATPRIVKGDAKGSSKFLLGMALPPGHSLSHKQSSQLPSHLSKEVC